MERKAKVDSSGASKGNGNGTANLGFEQKLWLAADKLRGTMDAAEYKHTVLGLIFLKYISDSFESRRQWLVRETANPDSDYFTKNEAQRSKIAEDRDEYPLPKPPPELAGQFARTFAPILDAIVANSHECRSLVSMRDALLPKLLAGDLRIADSDKCRWAV